MANPYYSKRCSFPKFCPIFYVFIPCINSLSFYYIISFNLLTFHKKPESSLNLDYACHCIPALNALKHSSPHTESSFYLPSSHTRLYGLWSEGLYLTFTGGGPKRQETAPNRAGTTSWMVNTCGWLHSSWSLSVLSPIRCNFYYLNYVSLLRT